MKRFSVSVAYAGSIIVEIEAENEDDACEKAEEIVCYMDDEKFLHDLEPQHAETNVIEEITDENQEKNNDSG